MAIFPWGGRTSKKRTDDEKSEATKGRRAKKAHKTQMAEMEEFAREIKRRLGVQNAFISGSVQMLGVSQIKRHFGKRWVRAHDRVHSLICSIMESRLGPSDSFTLFGQSTYVIVFSTLSPNAASMKVALIAQEISRRLFGDKPPPNVISIGVATIDENSELNIESLNSGDLISKLVDHHQQAENFQEISVGPVNEPDNVIQETPLLADTAKQAKQNAFEETWNSIAYTNKTFEDWHNFRHQSAKKIIRDEWQEIREDYKAPDDLLFVYRPAWLIKNGMIAAHTCVPARVSETGVLFAGGKAMPSRRVGPHNYSLDLLALQKVMKDFDELEENGQSAMIVIPVHVQTLDITKFRNPYKDILQQMSAARRKSVVFEVIGINETTPTLNVSNAISVLHPFSRDVMVRTKLSFSNFFEYHSLGVHAIGVDLGNVPMTESQMLPAMMSYNERAQKNQLHTFAHGIRTRSMASGAAAAGFRYIDGRAIATPVEKPEPRRPWTASDVYMSLIEELER